MLFNPSNSKKQLDNIFKNGYYKLRYNPFRWWRLYDRINKPLDKRQPLLLRIQNGDFDYSHYIYQAELVEHKINELYIKCGGNNEKFIDESRLEGARRQRLLDDFEKDENNKLDLLKIEFSKQYRITKEQVEKEMLNCLGTLEDLYYIIEEKYSIKKMSQSDISKMIKQIAK